VARVWRRRRSLDTPRPAGRRWARLRRGSSRATQLIARVALRRSRHGATGITRVAPGAVGLLEPRRELDSPRTLLPTPVSPAVGPSRLNTDDTPRTIPLLPGERTPVRRLKFAIANGCTLGSLLLGLVAIYLATSGGVGHLRLAAVALLGCVVLDGCDGGLARRFNVASPFGAQLDSLADLGSFGLATGIVSYRWLVELGASSRSAAVACALVVVCAAIRLARFNVSPRCGTQFCGVPTTMVAAVFALDMLLEPDWVPVRVQVAFVAVYAVAMVSTFPYVKLARLLRLPLWVWSVPAIGAMISLPGTFIAIAGGYLISGPVVWLVRRRRADTALPA
jgi:CDP-diacylglycerol--serine O-phosphatidyltransferase